jgi:hypothetical protein
MGALAGDTELVGDLGLGAAPGEQLSRTQPSGLTGGTHLGRWGRRMVGIAGRFESTTATVNPTHETQ